MASELDVFEKQGVGTATTLSAPGKATSATSITVGSTANFPTTTGITFAIRVVDGNGELVAGTYTEWVGTVTSGTTLAMNAVPVYGSDQVYTAGSTTQVYMPLSSYSYNKMIDGLLAEHEQLDGKHKTTLITSRTEDTAPDVGADFLLSYDTSATALKKVKPSNLGLTTGWVAGQLPAVNSVTENGNRSADITFASTVASILTPGMRIRTSRTVAAPTQSTSLNGTTQYYSKASPNKMAWIDDFAVSAWIKITSYAASYICSRFNGTSGWGFLLSSSGQVQLLGFNAGGANFKGTTSYQSIPLNKWVHVAAQIDMNTATTTSTTNYVMIDGVDVPTQISLGGTAPTALIQAGNLEIGAANGGTSPLPGAIAQVAIYNAKVTQANIRLTKNQGLSGSETSLASAYSFNNVITDLNTTTPNDLTANGSAVATNASSPFCTDANGVPGGTYDWGIVTKVATTVATVQYPEGCAIPTSGGISTVDYSGVKSPFGMPVGRGRWITESVYMTSTAQASAASTPYNNGSAKFTPPAGPMLLGYLGNLYGTDTAAGTGQVATNLSYTAANNTPVTGKLTSNSLVNATGASNTAFMAKIFAEDSINNSSATAVYANINSETALDGGYWYVPFGQTGGRSLTIYAVPEDL